MMVGVGKCLIIHDRGGAGSRSARAIRSLFAIILISNLQISYQGKGQGGLLAKTQAQGRRMNLAQILSKNELIMMLLLSRVCRIVLFSHNITTVITITLPRKTGGLLTKDDVDFARC